MIRGTKKKKKEWKILLKEYISYRIHLHFVDNFIFIMKSNAKPILFLNDFFQNPMIRVTTTQFRVMLSNQKFIVLLYTNGIIVYHGTTLKRLCTVKSKSIKSFCFYDTFHIVCLSTYGNIFVIDLRTGQYKGTIHDDHRECPKLFEVVYPSIILVYNNRISIQTNGTQYHSLYTPECNIIKKNSKDSFWFSGKRSLSFCRFDKKNISVYRFRLPRKEHLVDIFPLSTTETVTISNMGTVRLWDYAQKCCLYKLSIGVSEPYSFQLKMYKNEIIFQHFNAVYVLENPIVERDRRNWELLQQSKSTSIFNMYGLETLIQSYLFLV